MPSPRPFVVLTIVQLLILDDVPNRLCILHVDYGAQILTVTRN